jgi:geranylgeranyl diphosphate synthase, type II
VSLAATSIEESPEVAPADLMNAMMRDYGRATRRAVKRYLANDRPAPFLDDLVADYPGRGGKMMRPSICIANARVFGGRLEEAVRSAAAIELLHNGLLIHDDIQDGSELRRGRPTLHALHGVPLAINAGDALMLLALRPLLDTLRVHDRSLGQQVLDVTLTMARQTAEGQALELGWRDGGALDLDESDYLTMVLKKTAWLAAIWPAQLGVLIGSAGRVDPECVVRFGFFLGAAFQIEDDLRNLSDDPGYGKERNGDLFEGKRTLMLIHVRGACNAAERGEIDRFLALPREYRTLAQADWLAALMARYGSIDYARGVAAAMAGAAAHEFSVTYGNLPASPDRAFIAGLVPWVFSHS